MTDLDRLNGTPLLMAGFESFLKAWLAPQTPSEKPLGWNEEEMALFRSLPEDVQEFYEIVNRWPGSKIGEGSNQDFLYLPPRKRSSTLVDLAWENQGNWTVAISTDPADYGKLYTDTDAEYSEYRDDLSLPMDVSAAEFLVTFGFHQLAVNYTDEPEWNEEEVEPEFLEATRTLFTGRYHGDMPLLVHYHPDEILTLVFGHGGWWSVKRILA